MATIQHAALAAIASGPDQKEMFAFCEAQGIYYHEMEPPYLTMARIASWALLMKNTEVKQVPIDPPKPKNPARRGFASADTQSVGLN
jgi:hypothetical protein